MKKMVATLAAAAACGLGFAAPAQANPFGATQGIGCEDIGHPTLLNWIQRRTICDGARYADGHWDRVRIIYTPAHTTSASSYCGSYSCSFTPAASYDTSIQEQRKYPVSDAPGAENQPLSDEPGWLPPGTDNIG